MTRRLPRVEEMNPAEGLTSAFHRAVAAASLNPIVASLVEMVSAI